MGNCTTKPKVLMDSDDPPPPEPERQKKEPPAEEDDAAAAATRRSEKGKEIMVEGDAQDDEQQAPRRPSLSHLFNEDKQQRKEIQIETTEPEPVKLENKNQTGPSSDVPDPGFAFPEVPNIKIPQPMEQEIKKQTDSSSSSSEVPKLETFAPQPAKQETTEKQEDLDREVLDVKVPQEMTKNQTDPSTDQVAKMEAPVTETSEVVKIPEAFVEAKEVSGTVADRPTPQEPVFVDAREKIEPIGINGAMATDKKELVSEEANNAKYTVFVGTENNEKDETTSFPELGTEEQRKGTEKPEVAK